MDEHLTSNEEELPREALPDETVEIEPIPQAQALREESAPSEERAPFQEEPTFEERALFESAAASAEELASEQASADYFAAEDAAEGPPTADPFDRLQEPVLPPQQPDSAFFYPAVPEDEQQGYGLPEDAQQLPRLFPEPAYPPEAAYAPEPAYPSEEDFPPEDYPAQDEFPRKRRRKRSLTVRILLFVGKWLLAIALIIAIAAAGLIGYLSLTEYSPDYAENAQHGAVNVKQLAPPTQSLRLLTFNTGYAGLGEDADFFLEGGEQVNPDSEKTVSENMDSIAEMLEESNADFLLLQEVDKDSARSFEKNQWLTYEKALEDYESRFALNYSCDYVPYPLTDPIGKVQSGLATYSRYDIASSTRYSLPCPFSWPSRIANLKRCFLVTRITLEKREQELVLVNVHLEAYDGGEGKEKQTEQLLQFMQQEYDKGNYVIVGGDFNQSFPDATAEYPLKSTSEWKPGELERLPAGWEYYCDADTPTARLLNQPYKPGDSKTQFFVIDGFIVSDNIRVTSVKTLAEDFIYSDHNPVVLEFNLAE